MEMDDNFFLSLLFFPPSLLVRSGKIHVCSCFKSFARNAKRNQIYTCVFIKNRKTFPLSPFVIELTEPIHMALKHSA